MDETRKSFADRHLFRFAEQLATFASERDSALQSTQIQCPDMRFTRQRPPVAVRRFPAHTSSRDGTTRDYAPVEAETLPPRLRLRRFPPQPLATRQPPGTIGPMNSGRLHNPLREPLSARAAGWSVDPPSRRRQRWCRGRGGSSPMRLLHQCYCPARPCRARTTWRASDTGWPTQRIAWATALE